jgi:D-arabinose 5-phosphate isomerase GutQ
VLIDYIRAFIKEAKELLENVFNQMDDKKIIEANKLIIHRLNFLKLSIY